MLIRDTRGSEIAIQNRDLGIKWGYMGISKDSPLLYIEDRCHLQMLKFHLATSVRLGVSDSDITLRVVEIRGFIKLV